MDLPHASTLATRTVRWFGVLGCLVIGVWQGGCLYGRMDPAEIASSEFPARWPDYGPRSEPVAATDLRAVLARDDWIHATRPQTGDPLRAASLAEAGCREPRYRWRYPAMEDLLAGPAGPRSALRAALHDRDPIVAANAAIGLARLGEASSLAPLTQAVRAPEMKLPMRLAAAEALGAVPGPSAVGPLRELIDQYGDPGKSGRSHPVFELHAELLRGLARHVDPADDPRFVAALRSPAGEVRLEALRAWSGGRSGSLPPEAIDLRADPDPHVRAAAMACLARSHHPEAKRYLAAALGDCDLRVRTAAIAALGELGGPEARKTLDTLCSDPTDLIRARAVSALAAMGEDRSVLDAAGDKSWRVREAVAEALARCPHASGAAVALELIDDPSAAVRQATVASLAGWPVDLAGPILLAAMHKSGYITRKTAAERLAALWPPAAEFPVDGPAERRSDVLGQLERRFENEMGRVHRLETERDVRPETDAAFKLLDQLASDDVTLRRQAAEALAGLSAEHPLGRLAVGRLAALAAAETDALVWQNVLAAVADDPSEAAVRLACTAMGHRSPEVRLRACEHLAAHCRGGEQHTALLVQALKDESPLVVRAAARALGVPGRLQNPEPLKRLLLASDDLVRLEAAIALSRLGHPSGPPALERLSYSSDHAMRRQVAVAMGEIADPSFVASLLRLLDDHHSVRLAALEALPKVVGRDVAEVASPAPTNVAERIDTWKRWSRGKQ